MTDADVLDDDLELDELDDDAVGWAGLAPTLETHGPLQEAHAFFNRSLFDDLLPECMITLQRKDSRSLGFYQHNKFERADGTKVGHIAMNPEPFLRRDIVDTLSTLVHEMAHQWQHEHGKPSRSCYHNKEWAAKMVELGLQPSTTGKPGGKTVGQKMDHYVIAGGPFKVVCREL